MALAVVLLFLVPISYVLSIGPASRLLRLKRIDSETYETIYAPMCWAATDSAGNQTLFGELIGWYCELFTNDFFPGRPFPIGQDRSVSDGMPSL